MVPGPLRPFRRTLSAFVALIATASPTHAQSINLSWDDCGAAGTEIKSFACDVNTGVSFDLVGSFVAPPGINQFLGISADLRVAATTLPDWWKIGTGQCRTAATISANFDPSSSCADLFNGNGVGAALYEVGGYGLNTARILLQVALPLGYEQPLQSGLEYSAFHLVVLPARTTGASSCGGCLEPVRLTLNSIQVFQPDQANNNPILTSAGGRRIAYWQGATGSLPVIASFAPAGAAEGASVTVSGTGLTSASLVRFGGVASVPTTTSESEVGAMVPAGAHTGALEVDTPFGTAASAGPFVVAPTITQFIPAQAPVGASVRIYGRNFTGVTSVLFGAQPATFSVSSDSEVQATVPAGASSGSITVINLGGSGSRDGFALGPAVGGINLSWNDCGIAGQSLQMFACNSNVGPGFLLVGSFVPPSGIGELRGVSADLQIASTVLPDWWKFGPGQCRLSTPLTASFDFAGMSACTDPWGAAYGMAWIYNLGFYGPETARLRVFGDPLSTGVPVQPDREYYAFKIRIAQNKTVGTGICAGCSVPTSISLQSLNLNQFGTSTTLSLPLNGVSVLWQGVPGPIPIVAGFTPPGGPVGTPVTVTGSDFLAANAVRFGTVPASFSVVSEGEISTSVPVGAQSSRIEVQSPSGSGLSSALFHLPPVLTDVIPPIAPIGSSVVLRGINLGGVTSVTFAGQSATFVLNSEQQITATVPPGAVSGPVAVLNPGGSYQLDFTVGPTPTGSMNLSWDDCGVHGVETKAFACDANSGVPFRLVVSFQPPPGIAAANTVISRIRLDATTLPDWWKHGTGQCRGGGGITAALGSVPSCSSPWPGLSGTTIQHSVEHYGPNTARLTVFSYPPSGSIELPTGTEYVAAQLLIQKSMATGAGSCAGCENHVRLTLEEVEITQTSGYPYNPIITVPGTRSSVLWQGAPGPLPMISSLVPPGGAAGAPVAIRGSGLATTVAVDFNGTPAIFSAPADTAIDTSVPANATTGPVRVRTRNGSVASSGSFLVAPIIISFRPSQAPEGTTITINGINFTGTTQVLFNGLSAAFNVVTNTKIHAVVPVGATDGPISASGPGGTGNSSAPFIVGPVVDGINLSWSDCGVAGLEFQTFACNSNSGPPFSLFGSFEPPAGVDQLVGINAELRLRTGGAALPDWWKFGPGYCRTTGDLASVFDFSAGPSTCRNPWVGTPGGSHLYDVGYLAPDLARLRLFVTAPAGTAPELAVGEEFYAFRVDIKRSMTGGTGCGGCTVPLAIELASMVLVQPESVDYDPVLTLPLDRNFAYWQAIPRPVPVIDYLEPQAGAVGASVTIHGGSFAAVTDVRFNNNPAPFVTVSDTILTATVPTGARTGLVHVSSADGTGSSPELFIVAPELFDFTPAQAPPGVAVQLHGANFVGTTQVLFNGIPATFTVLGDTRIQAIVPAGATTGPISATNPGGTAVSGEPFVVGPLLDFSLAFDSPVAYATGGGLIDVALSDVDLDGDFDAVATCYGAHTVEVRRNAGNGTFGPATVYPAGWSPYSLVRDLDGDLLPDLATVNFQENTLSVRRNLGGGSFDSPTSVAVGSGPRCVTAIDWDRDGDLELAVAEYSASTVRVLQRTGPGLVYTALANFPTGSKPKWISAGDLDGDGWDEVVTANDGSASVTVLEWMPASPPIRTDLPMNSHPAMVALADVNNDGLLDLATANENKTVSVRLGTGGGAFAGATQYPVASSFSQGVIAAELDGDGDVDLAATNYEAGNITVLSNRGDGTFDTGQNFPCGPYPRGISAGDLDLDGNIDLAATGASLPGGSEGFSILFNRSTGGVVPSISGFAPAGGPVGTPVTVSGIGFTSVFGVRFGTVAASIISLTDTVIHTSVPTGARSAPIFIESPGRTARSTASFYLAPNITHLSPPTAPAGALIGIRGTGLAGATSVTFNGTSAEYTSVSDELITATVPAEATGGEIAVTNPGGSDVGPVFTIGITPTGRLDLAWEDCGTHGIETQTFACDIDPGPPFPLVASFRPPPGVSDLVSLAGDIRVSATTLPDWWKHGPGRCRSNNGLETSMAGTSTCPTPWPGGTGTNWLYTIGFYGPGTARLTVTVTPPGGGTIALDPDQDQVAFRVLVGRGMAAGTPSCAGCSQRVNLNLEEIRLVQSAGIPFQPVISVPATSSSAYWQGVAGPPPQILAVDPEAGAPGSTVTIRGRSLAGSSAVYFHNLPAFFSAIDDSTLSAIVPDDARSGYVAVATVDGSAQSPEVFRVAPRIVYFSPSVAPVGHLVQIVGVNFVGATEVRFGAVLASFETVLDTLIHATVPPGITSETIVVTNPGGSDTTTALFRVGVIASEGINLSWDDCGDAGESSLIFACNTNTGPPFTLVASFAPPTGVTDYLGLSALVTIVNRSGALPNWWHIGPALCRGSALSASFDFAGGPSSCVDAFGGQAAGGHLYQVGGFVNPDPSKAQVLIQAAIPEGLEGPLDPATEYYAFKLNLLRSRTTGSGSCSGCDVPMCIQLNEIQLFQPIEKNFDPKISSPMTNNVVTWQGGVSCFISTPVQVAVVIAEADAGEVRLAWELPRGDGATLYRRDGEGDWRRVTRLTPDGERHLEYLDRDVRGGATYGYRLGLVIGDEEIFAGEISVTVPVIVTALSVRSIFWSARALNATLALPGTGGARFEVFDLGGRRAFSTPLDHLGAGEHRVEFAAVLRPGVYFGRVTQGSAKASARFVVLQ